MGLRAGYRKVNSDQMVAWLDALGKIKKEIDSHSWAFTGAALEEASYNLGQTIERLREVKTVKSRVGR